MLHRLDVVEFRNTVILDLDIVDRSRTRCCTTYMEGTHRQLCAGLANRLRRDHANGFADVDAVSARQVTTVALCTHAVAHFTGNWRTNQHVVDRQLFETRDAGFIQHRAGIERHSVGSRNQDRLCQYAAKDALAQRLDHIATLNEW